MKTLLWYALLLMTPMASMAQPEMPEYGKIDKADLLMTDCDFDAGATAYKLLDYGKVRFAKSKYLDEKELTSQSGSVQGKLLKVVTERRVRIKILKKDALQLANVAISFFVAEENIKKPSACTYNIDENGKVTVSEVGKDGIYVNKITKNTSQLVMVMPNVKVGSVIEYKYILETENEYFVRDWYFQSVGMPIRLSYYDINIPLTHGYGEEAFINHTSAIKSSKQVKETFGEGTTQFEVPFLNRLFYLQNIKSIKSEPYTGAIWDYMQRVYHHSVGTGKAKNKDPLAAWRSMANMLSDLGGYDENVIEEIPGSEALVEQAKQQQDTAQKIKIIYEYLRNNFTCTQAHDIFPDAGAGKLWQKRTGTIADINLLLVNLLQKAGVNALVYMGSSFYNGMVSVNYPSYKQFDVLLAYVPYGNAYYLLNAADKESMMFLVPYDMLGTKGLVVNGDESVFLEVSDNGNVFQQFVQMDMVLDGKGRANGKALLKSDGYAKAPRVHTWLHEKDKFASRYLAHPQFSIYIDSLAVSNETLDEEPLLQTFNFNMPLNNSGAYYYLNTNLFTGLTTNMFIDDERRTDVEFRYAQSYYLNVNLTLPDGYVLEEMPKDQFLMMADSGITCKRKITVKGNAVKLHVAIVYKSATFGAKYYEYLKDFYKKMFNLLNEPIVLKKNN